MASMLRGQLVAVVDGPAMILNIRGTERKFDVAVSLPLTWVSKNMDQQVTVMVDNGRIIEVL